MEKSTAFDASIEKAHFLDYWQVISKRKEVIIATFLIIVFVATILSLVMPSTYTGTATIKVESSRKDFALSAIDSPRADVLDPMDFATHYELMRSPVVLDRVIEGNVMRTVYVCPIHRDTLLETPTNDGICPVEGCEESLVRREIRKYPDWEPLNQKWAKRDRLDRTYMLQETQRMLLGGLRIQPRVGTKLIDVRYNSRNKNEAAEIANMLCEVYLQYTNYENSRRLTKALNGLREQTWDLLRGKKDEAGETVEPGLVELENELTKIKREFKLIVDNRTGTLMEWFDFNPLVQQENQLKAQIAAERILLNSWQTLSREQRLNAFSKYTAILNLKQALLAQRTELSKLQQEYEPEHHVIKQMNELISDLEQNLEDEIEGIIFNQEQLVKSLEEQATKIREIIEDAREEYYEKEQKFYEYRRKLEEVNRRNQIYSTISQRQTLETIKEAIPSVTLQISELAQVPLYASGPRRLQNIIIGIVVGLSVGTGLAYFIEYLDTSIKTIDDIERTLGLQILGVIPQKVRILTEESPNSPAYEAYRILWTNIEFARQENRIQSLLVTSGGVAEGKTTTIVNLAIAIANSGLNVLIVDSDFRRPRVHRLLDIPNQVGLTDILMRNADPDGVIARSDVPNLWVVPSGKLPPNAVGLLTSKRLKECVDHFANKYDIVLYDSPPVLGLSDSTVMASLVDRTLLCVEYRKYPKTIALRAKKIIENIGGKLLGGVINNINVLKEDPTYYSQVYHYFQAPTGETEEIQIPELEGDERAATSGRGRVDDEKKWE
jgi:capsular exopolysaccharide synthesis family protein